ncbi:MAG: rod shape-determining protein MreD [Chlamydiia bacterium]|nr:rod shape-determining protein MreD [Chlamydiia bacterium]
MLIGITWIVATCALFMQSSALPALPFHAYHPWIALITLYYPAQKDLWKPLWFAALCGLLPDLLSNHPMGLHPITYTLASALLLRFRNHLLYRQPLHLLVFTTLMALVILSLQTFFLFLFDKRIAFTGKWTLIEWAALALFDGLYALVGFSLPLALGLKLHHAWTLFWLKRNNSTT